MNILAYHGTFNNFDKFTFKNVGTGSGTTGAGFGLYFSESKADALGYGDIVYTCFLELQNNLSNDKVTIQPNTLKAILETLITDYGKSYYEQFGYQENLSDTLKNRIVKNELSDGSTDTEIIGGIINGLFGGKCDIMMEVLTKFGYTHTTDKKTPEDSTITHYIVYDLGAITIQKKENLKFK
jgi:hypothetical protein